MREVETWVVLAIIVASVVGLGGCTATPPSLSEQVKATCGTPDKGLGNVDKYATCAYTVLDVYAVEHGGSAPDAASLVDE